MTEAIKALQDGVLTEQQRVFIIQALGRLCQLQIPNGYILMSAAASRKKGGGRPAAKITWLAAKLAVAVREHNAVSKEDAARAVAEHMGNGQDQDNIVRHMSKLAKGEDRMPQIYRWEKLLPLFVSDISARLTKKGPAKK